jgi:putative SOS response-associated peptidase YedK
MCSHYQGVASRERFERRYGISPPAGPTPYDIWPLLQGCFIRKHAHADVGDDAVPPHEALAGLFGLVPHWARDTRIGRHTYNARSETVAEKPSFRDAWQRGQHCIIPAEAIFEPDWRSGKAVPARIALADGEPMGLAGLWARWRSPQGSIVHSYTMLTINVDAHPLMRQFHKPGEEKRMVVILPPERYADWLRADAATRDDFLVPYPAQALRVAGPQDGTRA